MYSKYHSVGLTEMLLVLGSPSFDTVMHNYRHSFYVMWSSHNSVVCQAYEVHMSTCISV